MVQRHLRSVPAVQDVGLSSCLACPYTSTVVHRRACNCNRIGNIPQNKNGNFAQVKDLPISTSVQKSVIPLNILSVLNYLHLQLLVAASEWFGFMDLRQCTANLSLKPCKLLAFLFFFRKRSHRTTTCHAKHLFVVSLFVCLLFHYLLVCFESAA